MKKILVPILCSWLALAFHFSVLFAQDSLMQIKYVEPPDSTAIGIPDGRLANKEIGPSGGTIMSADNRIELIFPAGALEQITLISIQPTTNFAPNGTGKAYWFNPSGIQFKKPVQLIFHYTDEEAETCPAELMGLAMQDKTGKWDFLDYEEWDSVSKTLKGFIHHFSGASNVWKLEMYPEKFHLSVNESTELVILDVSRKFGPEVKSEWGFQPGSFNVQQKIAWYVNGVRIGNSFVGTINQDAFAFSKNERVIWGAYTAPSVMPRNNPVTIKGVVYVSTGKEKNVQRVLKCYVSVYDAYKISVINNFTGRVGMGGKLVDSASFVVVVDPEGVTIDEIKNYSPSVLKEGKRVGCKEKHYVEGAPGPINITETTKNFALSKDYPPEVYFEFPTPEILLYKFQYRCRGGVVTEIEPIYDESLPEEINFIANGKEQRYHVTAAHNDYHLIVKPLK